MPGCMLIRYVIAQVVTNCKWHEHGAKVADEMAQHIQIVMVGNYEILNASMVLM